MRKRVVIDTNVVVSGTINKRGAASKIIDCVKNGVFKLLYSRPIKEEYEDVLRYLSGAGKGISSDDISEFIDSVVNLGIEVKVTTDLPHLTLKDPSDAKFLECAVDGKADSLITKNTKHYPYKKYNNLDIQRPGAFLTSIGK